MWNAARTDSDWSPLKDAARKIAFAEDRAVFDGYASAGIQGIRQGTSNPVLTLPATVKAYPGAVAQAVSQLRLAGVNGPYALVLGAEPYTAVSGGSDDGYPVLHHIQRLVDGEIVWAPAIEGGLVLTTRGGDFELDIGQDISIGYLEPFRYRRPTVPAGDLHFPAADGGGCRGAGASEPIGIGDRGGEMPQCLPLCSAM